MDRRIRHLVMVAPLALAAACARPAPDSTAAQASASPASGAGVAGARTVFTDTALFAEHCAQADSGLTPAAGRCTPRDQRLELVRPLPPTPRTPPR